MKKRIIIISLLLAIAAVLMGIIAVKTAILAYVIYGIIGLVLTGIVYALICGTVKLSNLIAARTRRTKLFNWIFYCVRIFIWIGTFFCVFFIMSPTDSLRGTVLAMLLAVLLSEIILGIAILIKSKKTLVKWQQSLSAILISASVIFTVWLNSNIVLHFTMGVDPFLTVICFDNLELMPTKYNERWMIGKTKNQIEQKYGKLEKSGYPISASNVMGYYSVDYIVIKFDENGVCVSTSRESYDNRD